MFKNFYKTIHTKYSRFLNFIFFLRYLFIVFFVSFALFIIIPYFFSYEKKIVDLSNYLKSNYNFIIKNSQSIKYSVLPLPHFKINNAEISFGDASPNLKTESLEIFPNFYSIYNFKDFKADKLILKNSDTIIEISELKFFLKKLLFQENNLLVENLKIRITENNNQILAIDDVIYANYGYKKDLITGKIFKKKIKIEINENYKNLFFKIPDSGFDANIIFDKKFSNGNIKLKILNSNSKLKFNYINNVFEINDFFFRSKNLSFNNNSKIILNPFLDINTDFNIVNLNLNKFKKLSFEKILKSHDLIKKINIKNQIIYKPKKFSSKYLEELNLKIDLAHGRVDFSKEIKISKIFSQCNGRINLLEDYPQLFFNCVINAEDKQKLLKSFGIKSKEKNKSFILKVIGNLNLFNNKINFEKISMDENYKATQEDLKYFKNTFENILFKDNFMEIFSFKKIKKFIFEIS